MSSNEVVDYLVALIDQVKKGTAEVSVSKPKPTSRGNITRVIRVSYK
jgi:hypothetical protein